MKKTSLFGIALAASALMFHSCKDKTIVTQMMNVPVYQTKAEVRVEQRAEGPRSIINPGKIFFKDNHILMSDIGEGVHIIDNTDPSNPVNVGFISIPGVIDLQMKNEFLYADSYMDLVVFDLSNLSAIEMESRVENVFLYSLPPHESSYPRMEVDNERGVVVGWTQERVTREVEEFDPWNVWGEDDFNMNTTNMNADAQFANNTFEGAGKSMDGAFGKAGSMSRFMVKGNHLYVLDAWKLISMDITNPDSPSLVDEEITPYFSETIFPMRGHLVLGTMQGIVFYGLDDPGRPNYVSEYQHIVSCDPVFVKGDNAYVTLRSGNSCIGWINELHIVGIEEITTPFLKNIYPMENPRGLSIDDNMLFLCDGPAGLKIYDMIDEETINLKKQYSDIQANDVISLNGVLMLVGENGIVQYDYSDPNNIVELSRIQVQ